MCDARAGALATGFFALPADLPAVARLVFEGGDFADAFDGARAGLPDDALGDFLRVFLDIRLPFVAFGGSIIAVLRVFSLAIRNRADRWASLMAPEYGYKEFEIPAVRSLNGLFGPNDE